MPAFGGIVALNRPLGLALATELVPNPRRMSSSLPRSPTRRWSLINTKKKNLRVLSAPDPSRGRQDLRRIGGDFLVQDADRFDADRFDADRPA